MTKTKTAVSLLVSLGYFCLLSFLPTDQTFDSLFDAKNQSAEVSAISKTLTASNEKFVLLQFWASFDGASRIENIRFARLEEQYRKNNSESDSRFALLSLSMDEYQSIYEETLKQDSLNPAQNMRVDGGFSSELANVCLPKNSFGNLLLNGQGKILAKNISVAELEKMLQQN